MTWTKATGPTSRWSGSLGQKQRAAIARALVNGPGLIPADEPTANFDSKIGQEVMRMMRRIAKEQGRSIIIVSHDPHLVRAS